MMIKKWYRFRAESTGLVWHDDSASFRVAEVCS